MSNERNQSIMPFETFDTTEKVTNLMISYGLPPLRECEICNENARLKTMKRGQRDIIVYRCNGPQRHRISIFKSTPFENTHLTMTQWWFAMYMVIHKWNNNISFLAGLDISSIPEFRQRMCCLFKSYIEKEPIMGGPGMCVHVGESVIRRSQRTQQNRRLPPYRVDTPTTMDDNTPNTLWIVGGIDESGKIFLSHVPNRQNSVTMTELLSRYIRPGSILVTNDYDSYPIVANNLNFEHRVVAQNANEFIDENGDHTNNTIDCVWRHLKGLVSKRHAALRSNLDNLLAEFTFRKYFSKKPDDAIKAVISELY